MRYRPDQIYYGTGSPLAICLLMREHGLGDDLHAMPAVSELINSGYDVTVYGKGFTRKCWDSIGAEFFEIPVRGLGWIDRNKHRFGQIHTLSQWSVWQSNAYGEGVDTIAEIFADLIGSRIPDAFSWIERLDAKKHESDPYVIFSSECSSNWRSIPYRKAREIFNELRKSHTVKWLQVNRDNPLTEAVATFEELIDLVYNASFVVGADNGLLNLAAALGIPHIGIFGMTAPESLNGSLQRYQAAEFKYISGNNGELCRAPCWGAIKNGFEKQLCCGQFRQPKCLQTIDTNKVIELTQLIQHN